MRVLEDEDEPTDEELRRFDQKRKNKKVSNAEWRLKTDADSRITKMKDGTTHLAYKAEHVVDLQTDLVLAAEVYHADQADSQTLVDSVVAAQTHLNVAKLEADINEVAADKGYHAAETLELAQSLGLRTYIAEPHRPQRLRWRDKRPDLQRAVYANRQRTRRGKGRRLQRRRSELTERTFAHTCETGGGRRTWLRGIEKVRKRWTIQAAARNLGLILRSLLGIGTARSLQDIPSFITALYIALVLVEKRLHGLIHLKPFQTRQPDNAGTLPPPNHPWKETPAFSTGC